MKKIVLLLSALMLIACTHKIVIQQGNVITQSQFDSLEKGMSKEDVRTVLGSPMLEDPFHHNRWDYPFTLDKEGKRVKSSRITLTFKDGQLSTIEKIGTLPTSPLVE